MSNEVVTSPTAIVKAIDGWNFNLTADSIDGAKQALVSCTDLAERLGYARSANLKDLATDPSHKENLNKFGCIRVVRSNSVDRLNRIHSTEEMFFNRKQALYLISKSGTPTANDLTVQFIDAFDALLEQYVSRPMSLADQCLMQAQVLVEQQRRQDAIEREQAHQSARLTNIESALTVEPDVRALPPAEVDTPEPSKRKLIWRLIGKNVRWNPNMTAKECSAAHETACNEFYREFDDRHGTNLKIRAKNASVGKKKTVKPIDILERDGLLEKAYALALKLYGPKSIVLSNGGSL